MSDDNPKPKDRFTEKAEMMMLDVSAQAIHKWLMTKDGIALCPNATAVFDGENIVVENADMCCVISADGGIQ